MFMPLTTLLENNKRWVAEQLAQDPQYFDRLKGVHEPHFLWIGCSDARVPANVVTGTMAGEMFVHRNIANLVVPTDTNMLAVLQYAVEVLKVGDIIVCGHEGCGGVKAAMAGVAPALVENWLAGVRTVLRLHDDELAAIPDEEARYARLVQLNVAEQVYNLSRTPVVQQAWARGQTLRLHGWVYALTDGILRDLGVTMSGADPERVAAPRDLRAVTERRPREPELRAG